MPTKLAELQQVRDSTRPPPPIATLIGFTLSAVAPGEAVCRSPAISRRAIGYPFSPDDGPHSSSNRPESRAQVGEPELFRWLHATRSLIGALYALPLSGWPPLPTRVN